MPVGQEMCLYNIWCSHLQGKKTATNLTVPLKLSTLISDENILFSLLGCSEVKNGFKMECYSQLHWHYSGIKKLKTKWQTDLSLPYCFFVPEEGQWNWLKLLRKDLWKITIFRAGAISALTGFHVGPLSRLNWNLEIMVFQELGKLENPENTLSANPQSKARTNNRLNLHMAQAGINLGHTGGRQVLSLLHYPWSPKLSIVLLMINSKYHCK